MSWGSWLKPRDAKGRESRTLAFVGMTWLLMTVRFALGGLGASLGVFRFEIGSTAMIDYGAAVAAILMVWLGREWVNKRGGSDV
jgi:hypothetical protein